MLRNLLIGAAAAALSVPLGAQAFGGGGLCNGSTASSSPRFASPPNQATLHDTGALQGPILGGTWNLAVTPFAVMSAFEAYVIAYQPANMPVVVPGLGTFTALVDTNVSLTVGVLGGSGLQLALPSAGVLCGVPLYAQAGVSDGLTFELSNAVDGICGQ